MVIILAIQQLYVSYLLCPSFNFESFKDKVDY